MKYLLLLFARLFSSELSTTAAGTTAAIDSTGGPSRCDARWDEALTASMFDENARMYLEHWGPRWK